MGNEMKNSNSLIQEKKETSMKIATVAKVSVFAAVLGFASLLPLTARAQSDVMPDSFPFTAAEAAATQTVQHTGVKIAKTDFEGKVSLPYDVKCEGKNLKAGKYLVSVKLEGTSRVVTLHGSGENVNVQVHEVPANRAASQSVLLVRKAGDGHSVEAVYVKALNTTLYLDSSLNGSHVRMDHLPIS
jgi:pectin methylesterase-like acyl-CoA thioesterase